MTNLYIKFLDTTVVKVWALRELNQVSGRLRDALYIFLCLKVCLFVCVGGCIPLSEWCTLMRCVMRSLMAAMLYAILLHLGPYFFNRIMYNRGTIDLHVQ